MAMYGAVAGSQIIKVHVIKVLFNVTRMRIRARDVQCLIFRDIFLKFRYSGRMVRIPRFSWKIRDTWQV